MKKILLLVLIPIACHAMEKDSKWDAEQYDAHSKQQYEASLEYLTNFAFRHAKPLQDKVFVDLGCGTAKLARHLAKKYRRTAVVGIDPEKNVIKYAREKHGKQENLSFICTTAQDFDLNAQFLPPANFVAFYHALHYIPHDQQQDAFNNIANNMAESGILDVSTAAQQDNTGLFVAGIQTFLKPQWWPVLFKIISAKLQSLNTDELNELGTLPLFSSDAPPEASEELLTTFGKLIRHGAIMMLGTDEISQLASKAGLEVVRCEEIDKVLTYDSKEDFTPWVTAVLGPYGLDKILTKEQVAQFSQDTVDLYCEKYNPGTDGKVEYRFKGLHLTAHKEPKN